MLIGYARVSTDDQIPDLQRNALARAGCGRIFEERRSGRVGTKRPALETALALLRPEAQPVVWKVDTLGRSLREMLDTNHKLPAQGVKLRSLTEAMAHALLKHPSIPVAKIAKRLGVSRATFETCVPGARAQATDASQERSWPARSPRRVNPQAR